MNRSTLIAAVFTVGLLAGCLPEKKIVWSRDGKCGAVIAQDGIFLCGDDGRLLSKETRYPGRHVAASWFPDYQVPHTMIEIQRLAVIKVVSLSKWEEIANYMSSERREQTIAESEKLLKDVMAYTGDWKNFRPTAEARDFVSAMIYMRETHPKELASKAGLPKELLEVKRDLYQVIVHPWWFGTMPPKPIPQDAVLDSSLDAISNLVVSPNGKAVAYIATRPPPADRTELMLITRPLEAELELVPKEYKPVVVAKNVSYSVDWTPDGDCLLYATSRERPSPKGGDQMGSVEKTRIFDKDGARVQEIHGESLATTNVDAWTVVMPRALTWFSSPAAR